MCRVDAPSWPGVGCPPSPDGTALSEARRGLHCPGWTHRRFLTTPGSVAGTFPAPINTATPRQRMASKQCRPRRSTTQHSMDDVTALPRASQGEALADRRADAAEHDRTSMSSTRVQPPLTFGTSLDPDDDEWDRVAEIVSSSCARRSGWIARDAKKSCAQPPATWGNRLLPTEPRSNEIS